MRISCICILKCKHLTKCWTAENIFWGKIGYNFVEKKPPYFRPKSPYQKCPISLSGPKNVSHIWIKYHNIQTFIGICSRSQVSVYRTIGPLVIFFIIIFVVGVSKLCTSHLHSRPHRAVDIVDTGAKVPAQI